MPEIPGHKQCLCRSRLKLCAGTVPPPPSCTVLPAPTASGLLFRTLENTDARSFVLENDFLWLKETHSKCNPRRPFPRALWSRSPQVHRSPKGRRSGRGPHRPPARCGVGADGAWAGARPLHGTRPLLTQSRLDALLNASHPKLGIGQTSSEKM